MNHIGDHPTDEMYASGLEIDCQCARCGSSMYTERCDECEEGFPDGDYCGEGSGVWRRCLSSHEWCLANPLPGREAVERGQIEWFTVEGNPNEPDQ